MASSHYVRRLMVRLGHDKDFEGIDACFEDFGFFRKVLSALFKVGNVFDSFREYGCLR
jgi:hypothetical protein